MNEANDINAAFDHMQRAEWLNRHGAPKDSVILTTAEFAALKANYEEMRRRSEQNRHSWGKAEAQVKILRAKITELELRNGAENHGRCGLCGKDTIGPDWVITKDGTFHFSCIPK